MAKVPNLETPEGFQLGYTLAKWVDAEEAKGALANGRTRCHNCAFRQGSYPNGSPQTTMDALKCALEGEPFYCHEDLLPCAGWALLRRADPLSHTAAFWPYSDEISEGPAVSEPTAGTLSGTPAPQPPAADTRAEDSMLRQSRTGQAQTPARSD